MERKKSSKPHKVLISRMKTHSTLTNSKRVQNHHHHDHKIRQSYNHHKRNWTHQHTDWAQFISNIRLQVRVWIKINRIKRLFIKLRHNRFVGRIRLSIWLHWSSHNFSRLNCWYWRLMLKRMGSKNIINENKKIICDFFVIFYKL